MLNEEEQEQIRHILKEELTKNKIFNDISEKVEEIKISDEIQEVKSDLDKYNNEFNQYSIEYRLDILERLILKIEKLNKVLLRIVLGFFIVSMILLVSFIILNILF
jgi:hypothetical protein